MFYEPSTLAMTVNVLASSLREEYGIDPEPVFRAAGIDPNRRNTPQCRYPLSTMKKLWDTAVATTGDPTVGLKTGWHITPAHYYALGFSWLASENLLGALQRVQRYMRIVSTASVELEIRDSGEHYVVSARFPDDSRSPPKEGIDVGLTALLRLCDLVSKSEVRPVRVELTCSKDVHPEAYREHLGNNIRFGCEVGSFYFDKAQLEEPLPGGTPDVAQATDRIAEQYLETLDPHQVASQVRRLLVSLLPSGKADQDRVASRLHRSTSTLQRQLQAEGTSYRDILDQTRKGLAEEYLRQRKLSHAQIAYLLGFSDQSNFSRAFKRWTRKSPREFQAV
ncbi:MAG: AraC family transcriptional regulator [Gammaproteobacteria bacterium]|nr:AraC family transcriptional regulator [Gammaproteobacteria bacterium]MDH5215756.1 AraC family transcriptional regulator [Gammaproteobacteria bacterium]